MVDLSWPRSMSVNDGIPHNDYLGKPINLTLPTIDYMSSRVRELGPGCYLYKLDLSRGYRQLRLDPLDWPIMSIRHSGNIYMDLCPPFGLRTAAMMMERTTMTDCYTHDLYGYLSKAYVDDFGAADLGLDNANSGYSTLKSVLYTLGLDIAEQKSCPPAHAMDWLGIEVNSIDMTLKIPEPKLAEVCEVVGSLETRVTTTKKQVQ